jgi:hypothetical protein
VSVLRVLSFASSVQDVEGFSTTTAPLQRTLDRLTPRERATFVKSLDTLAEELGAVDDDSACPRGQAD